MSDQHQKKTTTPMTPAAAARIQSQTAKSGTDPGFASRAQRAAAKNSRAGTKPRGGQGGRR